MLINDNIDHIYPDLVCEAAGRAKEWKEDFATPLPEDPVKHLQDLDSRTIHAFPYCPEQNLLHVLGGFLGNVVGPLNLPTDSALRERYEKWDVSVLELAKARVGIINEMVNSRLELEAFIVCIGRESLEMYSSSFKLVRAYEAVIKACNREVAEGELNFEWLLAANQLKTAWENNYIVTLSIQERARLTLGSFRKAYEGLLTLYQQAPPSEDALADVHHSFENFSRVCIDSVHCLMGLYLPAINLGHQGLNEFMARMEWTWIQGAVSLGPISHTFGEGLANNFAVGCSHVLKLLENDQSDLLKTLWSIRLSVLKEVPDTLQYAKQSS